MAALQRPRIVGLMPKTFQCERKLPEEYDCDECGFSTDLKAIMGLHKSVKHKKRSDNPILQRPFRCNKCEICDFQTFSMLIMTGHAYKFKHVVDDGGWFTCSQCEFATKNKKTLKNHILSKHSKQTEQWFTCDQCPYKHVDKGSLRRHTLLKHSHREDSEEIEDVEKTLKSHIVSKHSKQNEAWFKCDRCSYKHLDEGSLRKHVLLKHSEKNENVERTYASLLQKDLNLHVAIKRTAGIIFDLASIRTERVRNFSVYNLENHSNYSSNPKPFQCEWRLPKNYKCQYCFYETDLKITISVHIYVIHKKRFVNPRLERAFKYKCDICEFQTCSILVLTGHVYQSNHVPDDSGGFTCGRCPFKTVNKNAFKKHVLKKQCVVESSVVRSVLSRHKDVKKLIQFHCPECFYKCTFVQDLMIHISQRHNKSSLFPYKTKKSSKDVELGPKTFHCGCKLPKEYKCGYCDFKSDLKRMMTVHIYVIHQKRFVNPTLERTSTYKCEICDFQTYSLLVLTRHIYRVNHVIDDSGWFRCGQCPFKTQDKNLFKKHVADSKNLNLLTSKKHRILVLKCEFCPFKAKRKYDLTSHKLAKHPNERIRKFKCQQCPYEASQRPHLANHIKAKHTNAENIQWFECSQCSHKSKWKRDLKNHVLRSHENEEKINYYCKYNDAENIWLECVRCTYKTEDKSALKLHVLENHAAEEDWLQCGQCPFKSKARKILRRHVISEHENAMKCDFCPYETKNKQHLKYHIVVKHTNPDHSTCLPNERYMPYQCEQCSYRSGTRTTLRNHVIAKHTSAEDIQWFKCDECPYKSHRKANLRTHIIAKHTKEEEISWFQCEHCAYKAKDKGSLKKHVIRRHTNLLKNFGALNV